LREAQALHSVKAATHPRFNARDLRRRGARA